MPVSNQKQRERRLPVKQMCILALCRISEPIAFTSVSPYLPEMMEYLGVPENEVAKYAGLTSCMFPLAQVLTAVTWGRASDRFGRKPVILLSLTCTMFTSLLWGFSSSIGMAIAVRALAGAGNGTVGIIRTAVAEMVPWKELQPRAFSVMPLVWNIGSIFGPTLGGVLANPKHIKAGQPLSPNAGFLERFPYALPNMFAVALFVIGIVTGLLFLEETSAAKANRRDYGLELGEKIKIYTRRSVFKLRRALGHGDNQDGTLEREPLLKSRMSLDEENGAIAALKAPPIPPASLREVLHYQSILNLVVYMLLACHNMAFDVLVPIFMHHPVQDHSTSNPDFQPPFKFSGGFGLSNSRIGFLYTLYGVSGMLVQFLVFPPIARRYGVVPCLRVCMVCMPIIYFLVPFVALLPDTASQEIVMFLLMITKGLFSTISFPSSTILLTNSASSLRILGTLNGLATSVGATGRAMGPAIGGLTFTYGVEIGYVIFPWWVLSLIGVIAAIPAFWIIEGEGFGGDSDDVEDSEDEETAIEDTGASRLGQATKKHNPVSEVTDDEQETDYGTPGPLLNRIDTRSSGAASEDEQGYESDETPRGTSSNVMSSPVSRPLSRRPSRKMSAPIGMENRTISRKYSSNLGQSFGSAGSYNGQI